MPCPQEIKPDLVETVLEVVEVKEIVQYRHRRHPHL